MTTITALPTPVPSRADPANFAARGDALLGALPTFATETNLVASEVNAFAVAADASADAALASQTAAGVSATNSANSAIASAASAVTSGNFATAAAASAATAVNAPGTSATSTTSNSIGLGTKTYPVQTGKLFVQGMRVTAASTVSPGNVNHAYVNSYNSMTGALELVVTDVDGTGTFADWTIAISGAVGPAGTSGTGSISYTGLSTDKQLLATDAGAVYLTSTLPITVKMPDATTLTSARIFIIRNGGEFSMLLTDFDGNALANIEENSSVIIWGTSSASAAGIWASYEESKLLRGNDTLSASTASDVTKYCLIDTNKVMMLYAAPFSGPPFEVRARVLTITGDSISLGVSVQVSSEVLNEQVFVTLLDTNKTIITWLNPDGTMSARVQSVSGTTITQGAITSVEGAVVVQTSDVADIGANKVIVAYASGLLYSRVLTVSGTTITAGTRLTIEASANFASICKLDTDKALVHYLNTGNNATTVRVLTVSGSTITSNASLEILSYGGGASKFSAWQHSTNKALVRNDGNPAQTAAISVSGTTATLSFLFPLGGSDLVNLDGNLFINATSNAITGNPEVKLLEIDFISLSTTEIAVLPLQPVVSGAIYSNFAYKSLAKINTSKVIYPLTEDGISFPYSGFIYRSSLV